MLNNLDDMNEKFLEEWSFIQKYQNEHEEKIYKDHMGKLITKYVLSDRAVLARCSIVLKETIGRGSYSKVKEGYDLLNRREVAVKIIDCTKAPKDFLEKFLPRELDIWPKINHPNVIAMHNCVRNDNKIYMILEYASGGDMLTYIQKLNGPVPEKDCRMWMRQICSALQYLHQNNVIHRDLKLENLLMDSKRNIKLCDFGFSKEISSEDLSRTYCGSKAYASPEILIGQPYDPRKADVWAMGVIFFIFLTGNMPFKEDKCNQVILNQHKSLRLYWVKNTRISATAKQLIKSIFTYEWSKRPSIAEICNSEWLISGNSEITIEYNLRSRYKTAKRIDDRNHQMLLHRAQKAQ